MPAICAEAGFRGAAAVQQTIGTGQGLCIARTIATVHGGSISMRTGPGGLVVVTIDLPTRAG